MWQALKGEGEVGIWAREGERKGALLPRARSRFLIPFSFRTPATQASVPQGTHNNDALGPKRL